jgi:hypothetical protein
MTRLIEFDDAAFARSVSHAPFSVTHNLVDHPLLSPDAIADLAERMPAVSVERHEAKQPLVLPGGAPERSGSPGETVRNLDTSDTWMVLWYIEQVPEYARLLEECLAPVSAVIGRRFGGMCQQEAFLFLSAPEAVTPVHFDAEHNFLLQIRGTKDMNICEFPDRKSENAEVERYYRGGHRNLEAVPSEGKTFRLTPGQGVYVYPFAPHWVQNGDEASVSLSITFRTRASRRFELANRFNARLARRFGLTPRPVGSAALADRTKASAEMAYGRLRKRGKAHHA